MNILYKARGIYFFLAILTIFVGGFFLLQKIEELHIEAYAGEFISQKSDKKVSLIIFGDVMLDRNVRKLLEQNGFEYPFGDVKSLIKQFDFGVINLEGVYTDFDSVSIKNREILRFTFDPKGIFALKDAGINVVSQANNHTNDFGREGATFSRRYLGFNHIEVVGDFFNENPFLVLTTKSHEVAIVAFNEFSYTNLDKTLEDIATLKQEGKFVIVFPHFGPEYERFPSLGQKDIARTFIDHGADIVVGSHPHVVQAMEMYKNKPIFYSIGNFIFDQYFSKETQESLGIALEVGEKDVRVKLIPLSSQRSKPYIMPEDLAIEFLSSLADDSEIPETWKEAIISQKEIIIKRTSFKINE